MNHFCCIKTVNNSLVYCRRFSVDLCWNAKYFFTDYCFFSWITWFCVQHGWGEQLPTKVWRGMCKQSKTWRWCWKRNQTINKLWLVFLSLTSAIHSSVVEWNYLSLCALMAIIIVIFKLPTSGSLWPVWLNGRAFACDPKGPGFESRPVHFQVTALGKLLTRMCVCHQAV